MKISLKLLFIPLLLLVLSCSQENNTFVNRSYHNVTAKFNGYYNAREKVREGVKKLEENYEEDYKSLLPIYIYGTEEEAKSVASEMDAAIEKCSRVIEMHSMEIGGKQYCKWIDDAYMVIGQANFYKHEYNEAKSFFTYIAKEFKNQPEKYPAMFWLIKTNVEKGNFYEAEKILTLLENDRRIPKEFLVEKSIVAADFYIKQKNYEMAIPEIKYAVELTKKKKLKTRLLYILAQLYQLEGDSYLSIAFFKEVIKRHPEYEMEFYAKINLATAFNTDAGGGDEIIEILNKMLKDDKNKDYFDQIYYALAEIYLKQGDEEAGIEALKLSAKSSTTNTEQKGLSFYKLAEIYFEKLNYEAAQKYYDSTTTYLNAEHPDFDKILRISNSLNELVKNIKIIEYEDSVQALANMSEEELEDLIFDVIDKYEREQERKEREKEIDNFGFGDDQPLYNAMPSEGNGKWYFYNPTAISFGANEFKRIWGSRPNEDNWRRSNKESKGNFENLFEEQADAGGAGADSTRSNDPTTKEYYLQEIPFNEEALEASNLKLKKAYYDLGVVYKDQLEDNYKSIETLEKLVDRFDSSDFHLVSYYRLYLMHLVEGNNAKAEYYKNLVLNNYPDSDYALLIKNPDYFKEENAARAKLVEYYEKTYGYYQRGYYKACVTNCEESDAKFPDNDLKPKFLLLKAKAKGMMGEKETFISELETISKSYSNQEEGKEAAEILAYWQKSQEEAKKQAELDEMMKKGYAITMESSHTAVLIVPNLDMDINKVKIAISNFNTQYFKTDNLKINAIFLDKDQQMVSIKDFENSDKAKLYYQVFKKNNSYLKEINEKEYDFFVISFENYPIFFQKKNVPEYLEFFSKTYLEETN